MSPGSDRGRNGVELNLEDLTCPVCLEIFMEPVTLPCTHTFCKECFLESVDKATLCCPLCRKRVSTWARLNSKNKTLINQQLWTQIQTRFPLQCQRRVSGQEDSAEDDQHTRLCFPRVSEPGELRQEYEDQVTRLTEEKRALEEEQSRASEEFIQRLLQEEERLQQEETKRREEDERLAQLLSDQLNSSSVSQVNVPPADVTLAKKKKKEVVGVGQIERFLCRRPAPSSSSSSLTANKENILATERPLPSLRVILDYHGPDPDPDLDLDLIDERGASSSAKRKSSEDEEVTVNKRLCHCPPASSTTSSSSTSSSSSSLLLGGGQWEVELQTRRQQQEEEDRRLAQLLQKELDQEERRKTPDRRKGSTDAYLLRQHHPQTENLSNSSRTTTRASTKTAKTSSSPSSSYTSSPSSIRGSKQTTITEMFSGLSS